MASSSSWHPLGTRHNLWDSLPECSISSLHFPKEKRRKKIISSNRVQCAAENRVQCAAENRVQRAAENSTLRQSTEYSECMAENS